MGVLVVLEMDGSTEAVRAAAVDLEARRPTSAKLAQVVAPTESGVVVATFWESAEAREASRRVRHLRADAEHTRATQDRAVPRQRLDRDEPRAGRRRHLCLESGEPMHRNRVEL